MQIKTPRLFRNRCGVFYFRIKTAESDRRFSLRTKCPATAAIIALHLNADLERKRAMSNPKLSDFNFDLEAIRRYEIDLKNGVLKADGAADHKRMMEAIDRLGMIDSADRPLRSASIQSAKSEPLTSAVDKWLANCSGRNGARTVDTKVYHIKDFLALSFPLVESVERWLAEHEKVEFNKKKALRALEDNKAAGRHASADIEVNTIGKQTLVEYKDALLAIPQTPKTIDNKLNSLHDFFKYIIGHGLHTGLEMNPVDGMFIQTKKSRAKTTKSYQPFTTEALAKFFEPESYLAAMGDAPDLFWGPLLGIHTGMRIGEVTQIRCVDVHQAPDNGIHYIHVYKSKTPGGIRNVPISDALIALGFLDYAEECRAAGAERLFPHRLLINHSYSKELSAAMLKHQRARGIKAPQTSFHSFRVNVITQMHNNDSNTAKVMKIVGHDDGGGHAVHWGYVRDLPDLKPIVDKLAWPIDLLALRYNGRFSAFIADRNNWAADKDAAP
ncbi:MULTISPECIES: site-specific integrase [unclassified Janthinobacterium]|uniref:site-specific integrase n=1 Tax=unclassified Janthinobacterium TaxID=2610881 RepID=UPI001E33A18C|nr:MULTISPECIES: site-specific integrase [unclassified Janthinobacterium]MCC7643609.1 site-specific integrase [Janthinobacterium sp. EB271-G4-3-1]MCC7691423.1 site-specific integrase [Janthinobacterium sp. EB271-G4-3-2]